MASPLQFAYRTQKAIGVFEADPVYASLPAFALPEGNLRCCVYSPCGRYFSWASSEAVAVCDASTGHVLSTFAIANVFELAFSPGGTYLNTWERPAKDENGDATKNLKIWRSVTAEGPDAAVEPIGRFVQKSQAGWALQYTADEQLCARLVTNEVHFYQSGDLSTVHDKLRVEGVSAFALSPGQAHSVAVFIPERKGQPAAVRVFNVPHFATPASQKTFFKGDKVQLKWNAQGSSLLVLAHTDVDKSNKSYYGETTLYLLSASGGFDARITLDKEGPIHDVSWSPNSKEFGVIYGFMPAKITIFNQRAEPKHSFPIGPRNTIIFSPSGRFVLVAGFGNLAGQIDVYDLTKDYRKVCTIESGNPSVCEWSPDSRYILTATTSPRLRVDNGVKLWHVGGGLMYNEDMVELYNVVWRPLEKGAPMAVGSTDPLTAVPVPHASAATFLGARKTPSKPAGAYRPPGARGASTPLHFKREDEGGAAHIVSNGTGLNGGPSSLDRMANGFGRGRRAVPGADPVELSGFAAVFVPGAEPADGSEALSKAALKNKKKRNKKASRDAETANGDAYANGADGGRSPERRGYHQHPQSHSRSQSRNNGPGAGRNRSNTQRNQDRFPAAAGAAPAAAPAVPAAAPAADPTSPGASQNPVAKKIRSLQKKIRAIEDLEMRHAGGEKLEDTQIKKIGTKAAVMKELEDLERQ